MTPLLRFAARLATSVSLIAMPLATGIASNPPVPVFAATTAAPADCQLKSANGNIQRMIWLQFDNVHLTRDNPNVPSDLQQMPHLLNFIENNGALLSNHHTPLIAHTANDILTTLTGVYPDRHGVAVANSYRYFKPDGSTGPASAFTYWTDPLYDYALPPNARATDKTFNMLAGDGKNAPAPWVPFTRAGCNVGAVGTANIELENSAGDVPVVFGPNSLEAQEVTSSPDQADADFVGVAVHCAKGSTVCAAGNARPDRLPDEPGGYTGFQGLFGHKYVAPVINPAGPLQDLDGNVIGDGNGHIGFPGFDGMLPAVSLAYVAAMQEHGVPITFNYVSAAHDAALPFGPGEAGYEARLKSFDTAFGKFFDRMQQDGITPANTLFVITADEGDHLIAGPPSPLNCDGVTVPCTYSQIGELNTNLTGLLASQQNVTTSFTVHADAAPAIYLKNHPAQNSPVTRTFERALTELTALNPYSGVTEKIDNYVADQVEMKALHMVTADPARTPTITMFAKPDYFLYTGSPNCNSPCVTVNSNFNWNHGDVAPEINTTFLGLVGPGVRNLGEDGQIWTDHTDVRPTVLALLGLKDDYEVDGRVILEALDPYAVPRGLADNSAAATRLGRLYKQLNAPVGAFGLASLHVATVSVSSDTPGDALFRDLENDLETLVDQRNILAYQIAGLLNESSFDGRQFNTTQANDLYDRAAKILQSMQDLAANPS